MSERKKKDKRWSRRIGERERGDEKGEGMRGRRKIRRDREREREVWDKLINN